MDFEEDNYVHLSMISFSNIEITFTFTIDHNKSKYCT